MNTSRNFTARELSCSGGVCVACGGRNGATLLLVNALETLRYIAGHKAITLSCAYRCPVHNRAVGSRHKSYHVSGLAVDVVGIGEWSCNDQPGRDMIVQLLEAAGFWTLDEGHHIHADLRHWIKRHP